MHCVACCWILWHPRSIIALTSFRSCQTWEFSTFRR